MGITKDYNKINGRKPPILRVFKFLAAEETQDRGPRFSQRAVQQDGDRGGGSPITWTALKLNPGNINSSVLLLVNTYSKNLW